jgi:PRTRC genetic system protein B
MKDLTHSFGHLFHPVKALLIYQKEHPGYQSDYYVETYDMDQAGCPVNGHPLTLRESSALAKALQAAETRTTGFLTPKGLMPKHILYLNAGAEGFAVWHTPPQRVKLLFTKSLGIASKEAAIPAMVWKAGRKSLQVFAVRATEMQPETTLCHAPFFNLYNDGRVCMGNVSLRIPKDCGLEQFMELWQGYFFNSYFSHLIGGVQPVKGNIVQLWQKLTTVDVPFPTDVLIESKYQIQHLIL